MRSQINILRPSPPLNGAMYDRVALQRIHTTASYSRIDQALRFSGNGSDNFDFTSIEDIFSLLFAVFSELHVGFIPSLKIGLNTGKVIANIVRNWDKINKLLDDNSESSKDDSVLPIYQASKQLDAVDLKGIYHILLELIDPISELLFQSKNPKILAFQKAFNSYLSQQLSTESIKGGLSQYRYINVYLDKRFKEDLLKKAIPTVYLTFLMLDSSEQLRNKAREKLYALNFKSDKNGTTHIEPFVVAFIYSGLVTQIRQLGTELQQAASSPNVPLSRRSRIRDIQEFLPILRSAANTLVSSLAQNVNHSPEALEAIGYILDNASLEEKKAILKDLASHNIFANITTPEALEVRKRLYEKGYDLKNGKLLPQALLNIAQSGSQGVDVSIGTDSSLPKSLTTSINSCLVANRPSTQLVVAKDQQLVTDTSVYIKRTFSEYAKQDGSEYMETTITQESDIQRILERIEHSDSHNPKVLIKIDAKVPPAIRQKLWAKLHMSRPDATLVVLFHADQTDSEWPPFSALLDRINTTYL